MRKLLEIRNSRDTMEAQLAVAAAWYDRLYVKTGAASHQYSLLQLSFRDCCGTEIGQPKGSVTVITLIVWFFRLRVVIRGK